MKILVDMNLSPKWVDYLSGNNIEAVHWSFIGSLAPAPVRTRFFIKKL